MADEYDIVVAGGGIAGLTAGMYAARLGRSTLVVTGDVLGGHLLSIEKVEGFPGFEAGVAGYELCPITQAQAAEAGAEFAMSEVAAIAPDDGKWLVTTGDGTLRAGAVVLATGTSFRALGVPGEAAFHGKGVSQCASCDAPMLRGKPTIVVGGGDSALQEALTLAEHASSVVILHRGFALSAQATYRNRAAEHPDIDIRFNSIVEEILGGDGVTGVRARDTASGATAEILADGVFVFIGLEPNVSYLDGVLELDETGRIPTDTQMRTARPGLLAAGTVRAGTLGQAVSAAGDGAAAAIAAHRYLNEGAWPHLDKAHAVA